MARQRSPRYPFVPLEKAVEGIKQIHDEVGFHETPYKLAIEYLGYSPTGSTGIRTLAALSQFALIDEVGTRENRMVSLSHLAKRIVLGEELESEDYWEAIREAALSPNLYNELWSKWNGNLPSDKLIKHYLLLDLEFNQNAVNDFIGDFKRTIEFANLTKKGVSFESETAKDNAGDSQKHDVSGGEDDVLPKPKEQAMPDVQKKGARPLDIPIPLITGGQATLRLPIPMSEADYQLLRNVINSYLENMKQAIVKAEGAGFDMGSFLTSNPFKEGQK